MRFILSVIISVVSGYEFELCGELSLEDVIVNVHTNVLYTIRGGLYNMHSSTHVVDYTVSMTSLVDGETLSQTDKVNGMIWLSRGVKAALEVHEPFSPWAFTEGVIIKRMKAKAHIKIQGETHSIGLVRCPNSHSDSFPDIAHAKKLHRVLCYNDCTVGYKVENGQVKQLSGVKDGKGGCSWSTSTRHAPFKVKTLQREDGKRDIWLQETLLLSGQLFREKKGKFGVCELY